MEPRVCSTPSPTLPGKNLGRDCSLDAGADFAVSVSIKLGDTLSGTDGLVDGYGSCRYICHWVSTSPLNPTKIHPRP
jgi:hypothetical protein